MIYGVPYFPVNLSSSEILRLCYVFEIADFINGFFSGPRIIFGKGDLRP
jgi:hypothetical protein